MPMPASAITNGKRRGKMRGTMAVYHAQIMVKMAGAEDSVVIEKMTGRLSRERAESPERSGGTVHPEKFEFGSGYCQALRLY